VFSQKSLRLHKLTALVPISEEALEDAPMLDSYLRSKAPAKMGAALNTAIVSGTGAGQPLGILNSPSVIEVPAESGQAADTVLYMNIVNMWSRMYAPRRRNAVWLINQDVEPQLLNLAFRESASSPVPAYMPAGGLSSSPFATLMGRPVIPVEACKTLGDSGDIILVDLTQYMVVTKGTDIKTDVSMHLYFDAQAMAYRFIFRVAGQPWWQSAVSPQNGSMTRSWAVTLEDR
jgi:HK97 family phage major capsid protein